MFISKITTISPLIQSTDRYIETLNRTGMNKLYSKIKTNPFPPLTSLREVPPIYRGNDVAISAYFFKETFGKNPKIRNKPILRNLRKLKGVGAGLAPALVYSKRATARVAPTIFLYPKIIKKIKNEPILSVHGNAHQPQKRYQRDSELKKKAKYAIQTQFIGLI